MGAVSQTVSNVQGAEASSLKPLLSVRSVAKRFGSRDVLRNITLDIAEGEFLTILGESGSGKTTLLRLIAGFEQLDSGEIWMSGERLDLLPPYKRRVNTVFQHYALFPHLSVFDNVAYGLRVQKTPKTEIGERVRQALAMVKMETFAQSSPAKISGGQQQRVALARALVNRPRLLLLDEPLSALDANLRRQMQLELKLLQREVGIAFVFVTHDQQEAMAMSDRIALLNAGDLEQVATPREIYHRPASSYVAQFVGQTNLLRARVVQGKASAEGLSWPTDVPDGGHTFSLRPENVRLTNGAHTSGNTIRFRARVRSQSFQGATDLIQVETGGLLLLVRIPSGLVSGEQEFEFNPTDAICLRDNEES